MFAYFDDDAQAFSSSGLARFQLRRQVDSKFGYRELKLMVNKRRIALVVPGSLRARSWAVTVV